MRTVRLRAAASARRIRSMPHVWSHSVEHVAFDLCSEEWTSQVPLMRATLYAATRRFVAANVRPVFHNTDEQPRA
eukprot:CAMPEP_0202788124 /NCGR_PEP_ID=MMETSP1388-20130828/74025_1 /ASSEMBLY_ACC=CAM_ASM_000864 /TAXON_ID=37098 /ORGANISM="Isochrysis sp, Strain CCMP1244" /LENGTH=74 /DNA_ID=CAMNT_0049457751 /DNA_START=528 /DNA_END=752 /DNA_ORIENTATION=+